MPMHVRTWKLVWSPPLSAMFSPSVRFPLTCKRRRGGWVLRWQDRLSGGGQEIGMMRRTRSHPALYHPSGPGWASLCCLASCTCCTGSQSTESGPWTFFETLDPTTVGSCRHHQTSDLKDHMTITWWSHGSHVTLCCAMQWASTRTHLGRQTRESAHVPPPHQWRHRGSNWWQERDRWMQEFICTHLEGFRTYSYSYIIFENCMMDCDCHVTVMWLLRELCNKETYFGHSGLKKGGCRIPSRKTGVHTRINMSYVCVHMQVPCACVCVREGRERREETWVGESAKWQARQYITHIHPQCNSLLYIRIHHTYTLRGGLPFTNSVTS